MSSLELRKSSRESRVRPWLSGSVLSSARRLTSKVADVPSETEVEDRKPRPLNQLHQKVFARELCLRPVKPQLSKASCRGSEVDRSQSEQKQESGQGARPAIRRREAARRFICRIPTLVRTGAQKAFGRKKRKVCPLMTRVHFSEPVVKEVATVSRDKERGAPLCDAATHWKCWGKVKG